MWSQKNKKQGITPRRGFQSMRSRSIKLECYHYGAELYNNFLTGDADYAAWETFPYIGTNIVLETITIVCNRVFYLTDSVIAHSRCQPVREAAVRSMPPARRPLEGQVQFRTKRYV